MAAQIIQFPLRAANDNERRPDPLEPQAASRARYVQDEYERRAA